jgi:hypothetical protein
MAAAIGLKSIGLRDNRMWRATLPTVLLTRNGTPI